MREVRRVYNSGGLFRLSNYAAGDACRSTGCGSIGNGVNHDGSTPVAEHGILATPQSDVGSHDANMRSVVCLDYQRKLLDVSVRYGPVLVIGAGTTEVWTGRFKIGPVTFAYLVNMNGMLARGQILDVEFDSYAVLGGGKRRGADTLALGVF